MALAIVMGAIAGDVVYVDQKILQNDGDWIRQITAGGFCDAAFTGGVNGLIEYITLASLGIDFGTFIPTAHEAINTFTGQLLKLELFPPLTGICDSILATVDNIGFDLRQFFGLLQGKQPQFADVVARHLQDIIQEIQGNTPPGVTASNFVILGLDVTGQEFLHKVTFSPGEPIILAVVIAIAKPEDLQVQLTINTTNAGPLNVFNATIPAKSLTPGLNALLLPIQVPPAGPNVVNGPVSAVISLSSIATGETHLRGLGINPLITGFGGIGTAPTITASPTLQQPPPHTVGDTITGRFTLTNLGNAPLTFSALTLGGRLNGTCPGNICPDFLPKQSGTLFPGTPLTYTGTLTLTAAGSYHFFPAMQTLDNQWNTAMAGAIDLSVSSVPLATTLDITVNAPNQPPTITSLTATPSSVAPGGTSTISVTASDPENDPITYSWQATCGILSTTSGPGPVTWTAPGSPTTCTVTVSVTDNKPGHTPFSASTTITVQAASNQPPTISSLTASTTSVTPNQSVTLTVVASDPENDPLTYTWSASCGTPVTAGPFPDARPFTWTAPSSPTTCTITVSVTDNKAGHSPVTQSVIITVQAAPGGQITIGPTSLNFSSTQVGSCSTASFAIQHVLGTGPVSGTVSAGPNPPFSIVFGGSFSVSGSDGPLVTVQFCPTSAGSFSGTATVSSNASSTNTNTVSLTGTGQAVPIPPPGSFTLFTPTKDCPGKVPAIHLSWSVSTGADHYDLYRDGSIYPAGAGNITTAFTNTGSNVSFGVTYSYFVRAVGSTGLTMDSNQQSIQATCVVTVGGTGGIGLKLRTCASTNNAICPVITTLPDGTVMTIFGGPVAADGFNWYAIQGAAGTGWSAGDWLIP